MTCKSGLHPKDDRGECRKCKHIRQMRYRRTERGRESHRRADANYYYSMPALKYGLKRLKDRRRRGLQRMALRRTQRGSLQV